MCWTVLACARHRAGVACRPDSACAARESVKSICVPIRFSPLLRSRRCTDLDIFQCVHWTGCESLPLIYNHLQGSNSCFSRYCADPCVLYAPFDSYERIALLVASCPNACTDSNPVCPPPPPPPPAAPPPPPPLPAAPIRCHNDPTYSRLGWSCANWMGCKKPSRLERHFIPAHTSCATASLLSVFILCARGE